MKPILQSEKMAPLVSVVIPTYNRMPFITECIRSVQAQTCTDWELIVADDGSTDNTLEALRDIYDIRIRILELPHTGNIGWLRNMAVIASKGKWVAFLDSDDLWVPQKLELQLNSLQQSGKRWGYGRFELINESASQPDNRSGRFRAFSGSITDKVISAAAAVSVGSLIVERELFYEAGCFNTDLKLLYREDYELALRLSLKADADAIDELLVRIREHRGRSTNYVTDSHERTAQTFTQFLLFNPTGMLAKAAHKRRGHHLSEAAAGNLSKRFYLRGAKQLTLAIRDGDSFRHIASALKKHYIKS